ncbi:hypothetical protein CIB84_003285 [Bambusicola thoracicus]|uniref:Uncharacterized protein n=1 Tax=Bambusicola thoracicus TaxID=9083 RepID=A0A2P4T9C5_BAMTH|nr:hypothetical protein CIB84_003285 [Bambusicola thoracicus]
MRSCKMVRVASVLGLVMLSIALLILSLISYVSLKKDNIFGAPRAAGPGGPRMYMFHAGFRSQFALKFLDPSFVPITNSLGQELQEKPSKWVFNRTAFAQQRQEILQHVDVIKNFSLTKNSVRIGQLMHYDYSSHKYWKNKHLSPKRLSTGILMYTLASAICEEIHLYGFWPFGFDPNTREDLPYHYYDKKGTKFTTKWQESHQLPAEFQLLYRMHGEGLAKLTLSRCA